MKHKLFIDKYKINCPFCKNEAKFDLTNFGIFNYSNTKSAYNYKFNCRTCDKKGVLITKSRLMNEYKELLYHENIEDDIIQIIPSIDISISNYVPKKLRDLIVESNKCLAINSVIGASACIRKCIYEFLKNQGVDSSKSYKDQIKELRDKFNYSPFAMAGLDQLNQIQMISSDQVHEGSADILTKSDIYKYTQSLLACFETAYVTPKQMEEQFKDLMNTTKAVKESKKTS